MTWSHFPIKTIVGVLIFLLLLGGVLVGVRLTQQQTQVNSRASGTGDIVVAPSTITKTGGSWPSVQISVNLEVPGATGERKIAGVFVRRLTNQNSGTQNGWSEIISFGTNGRGVTQSYSPPGYFEAGTYEFSLWGFAPDGQTVDGLISGPASVTFVDPGFCQANFFDAANCRICSGDGKNWIESYGNNVNSTEWCSCAKRKAPDYSTSGTYATCRAAEGSGSNNAAANFTESTKTVYKQADGRWEPVTLSFSGSGAQGGARVYYSHTACDSRTSCGRAGGWTEIPPKNLYGSGGSQYSGQVTISSDQSVAFGINPGIHTAVVWNETASPQVTADNVALAFVRLEYKNEIRGSGSGGDITEAAACGGITFKKGGSVIASLSSGGTVSGSLKAGEAYDVTVTMRNVDASNSSYRGPTWIAGPVTSGDDNGKFFLGYMTSGDTGPGDQFTVNTTHSGDWGINWANSAKLRIALTGSNVSAGQSGTFNFSATPKNVGLQSFYWGMVHEGKTWFGGQCAAQFNVEAAGAGSGSPDLVEYRLSQGVTEFQARDNLNNATVQPYLPSDATGSMAVRGIVLDNVQPGDVRYIAVQFRKAGGAFSNAAVSKLIKYVGNSPSISGVTCRFPATGTGTLVEISGSNFGSQGTVKSSNKTIDKIESYADDKVVVRMKDKTEDKIKVKVVTNAGLETTETECQVNTSLLDFQVTNNCGTTYSADDVQVDIYDSSQETQGAKPNISQKIRVRNGKPQSFTLKLEANKNYTLIIKAPKTVARKVDFKAGTGTTVIDKTITLPVGDIAPVGDPDGSINANDYRELLRQWSVLTSVTRTGDFNSDTRVNSIDYSCFSQNNTKEDDVYTKPVVATSSATIRKVGLYYAQK